MHKHKVVTAALFVLLAVSLSNAANTIYVDAASPNDPGSGTFADSFRKIQDGINAASSGDTVLIRPGTYSGIGNYNLDPGGKSITICSTNPEDAGVVRSTVIDPNGAGRGFHIRRHEDANCVISGLTIRNGSAEDAYNGGGIYCYDSSPTIRNCVIQSGYAGEGAGGGVCFDYGNATIVDCIITDNRADYYGGGISCNFSAPVIIGCTISGNTAGDEGGGIDSAMSEPNILNCVIIDNNAFVGGGINCYYPAVAYVANCTLAGNRADYDVGGAVYCWSGGSAIIENSILWGNPARDGMQVGLEEDGTASIAYCDVQGGQGGIYDPCGLLNWGRGNIDSDPRFASFDFDGDANLWDFHLQSTVGRWNSAFYTIDSNKDGIINLVEFAGLAGVWLEQGSTAEDIDSSGIVDWLDVQLFAQYYLANSFEDGWLSDASRSPCVDAGDPNSDWAGEPWPNGKRINMGAYGGTEQASRNGNIADLNVDKMVNFFDLAELGKMWGASQGVIEDLDKNGTVDTGDLDIVADNWLWQEKPADFNGDGVVNMLDFCLLAGAWQSSSIGIGFDEDNDVDYEDLRIFCDNWLWQKQ